MTPRQRGIILDLDNTLYSLRSTDGTFAGSQLRAAVLSNAYHFLADRLCISPAQAETRVRQIRAQRAGPLSSLFEAEYGITRQEWFDNVWNIDPAGLITSPGPGLYQELAPVADRAMILTSSPRIWAEPALHHLGIARLFDQRIITGEHEICKPDPRAFIQAANLLRRPPQDVASIGDQNDSDIVSAKALGMMTIIIGPHMHDAHYRADNVIEALRLLHELEG